MRRMKKCVVCNSYTLHESHCGKPTKSPHPPKFSIEDRYAKYRRMNMQPGLDFDEGNDHN
jgi:H/ACA ribonucleoprotein complex subunit 3